MNFLKLPLLAVGLASALLVGGACGESSEPLDATGVEPAVHVELGDLPEGAALVDQNNLKFSPNKLTVRAGDIVYFRNDETATHTVTINGRNVTGDMRRDDVRAWSVTLPGVYKLTCNYHPQMKATITVE
ncbi:MAG: plastocyanin/azurin family copper-binding protein [Dehalococcoidia bacterium]